jgi:hypothetical protein
MAKARFANALCCFAAGITLGDLGDLGKYSTNRQKTV